MTPQPLATSIDLFKLNIINSKINDIHSLLKLEKLPHYFENNIKPTIFDLVIRRSFFLLLLITEYYQHF
jgi:hypothetical protein